MLHYILKHTTWPQRNKAYFLNEDVLNELFAAGQRDLSELKSANPQSILAAELQKLQDQYQSQIDALEFYEKQFKRWQREDLLSWENSGQSPISQKVDALKALTLLILVTIDQQSKNSASVH